MPEKNLIEAVPFHKLGDVALVKRALNALKRHYPGYHWRVGINDDPTGGVMYIMNMDLNAALWGNDPYGYVLYLRSVYGDPGLKRVITAGGEILERARMSRRGNTGEDVQTVDGVLQQHQPLRIGHG